MARKLRSYRLEESLIEEIDSYAKARKVSATQVVEAGVRALLDLAEGGVPDLPSAPPVQTPAWPNPLPGGGGRLLDGRQARVNAMIDRARSK